jgi:hypothetical protein
MPRVRPGTQAQGRDPEMHKTRKSKQWYFGMKISGTGGTCVPGDQAAVRIHHDPLPWSDEEHRPGEHAGGLGKSLPAAQAADGPLRGAVRPLCPQTDEVAETTREFGNEMLPNNDCRSSHALKTGSSNQKSGSRYLFSASLNRPSFGKRGCTRSYLGSSTVLRCLHTVGREIPISRAMAVIVCFCIECLRRISLMISI